MTKPFSLNQIKPGAILYSEHHSWRLLVVDETWDRWDSKRQNNRRQVKSATLFLFGDSGVRQTSKFYYQYIFDWTNLDEIKSWSQWKIF